MAVNPPTISRVRTFRDDFVRAQVKQGKVQPEKNPAPKPPVTPTQKATPTHQVAAKKVYIPPELNHAKKPVEITNQTNLSTVISKSTPKNQLETDIAEVTKDDTRKSLMGSEGRVVDMTEEDAYAGEGNIITDRKRERFKLFPAIWQSLTDWFQEKEEEFEEVRKPKAPSATILPAAERREVIRQAAAESAVTPKDDYQNLTKRVAKESRRPLGQSSSAISIKKRSELPPPSWTHLKSDDEKITKSSKPVITAAEKNAVPEATEVPKPEIKTIVEEPKAEQVPAPATTEQPVVEEVKEAPEPKPIPEVVDIPEPTTWPSELKGESEPDPEATTPAPSAPVPAAVRPAPYQPPQATSANSGEELVFSPWRVGAVALLAVLLGVSLTLWLFGGSQDVSTYVLQNQEESEALISFEENIQVALGSSSLDLQRNLLSTKPKSTTVVAKLTPVSNIAGETTTVSTEQIMTLLDPQVASSFIRNITDINFGLYRDREPFIVMRVNAFDTAFGGILEWEKFMSSDLSPLFGAPVSGTFDPQSRSANQIREPYFVDEVIANLDTRVLRDETQKERLAYTFIGRNIILLTANTEALKALANVVR